MQSNRSQIDFGVFSPQDVRQLSVMELHQRDLYDVQQPSRPPARFGVLDKRLGTADKSDVCETCGDSIQDCVGHFGAIRLCLPVFHIGYFKLMVSILQDICKVPIVCCTKCIHLTLVKTVMQPSHAR